MNSKEGVLLCVILGIAIAGIFLYERHLCTLRATDLMTKGLLPEPFKNISDGWAISHIILYAVLGYLFTKYLIPLFFVGVLWEVIEESYGWIVKNTDYKPDNCKITTLSDDMNTWWYGRWHDLVSNSIGLAIGYGLQKVYS